MKTCHLIAIMLALLVFPSCETLMKPMPGVPPEQRQAIYERASQMAFPEARKLGRSKARRLPLKKGQWIATLAEMKGEGEDVTLTVTKVISVEKSKVTLEQEIRSASGQGALTCTQITFENFPVKAPLSYTREGFDAVTSKLKIVRMRTKAPAGTITETPPQVLAMGLSNPFFSRASMRLGETSRTGFSGTYIASKNCFEHYYELSMTGPSLQGRSLTHSSVPVTGMVQDENDAAITTTVAYGYKGATSSF